METQESLEWIKENGLYEKAEGLIDIFVNVFNIHLKPTTEKILIIGDVGFSSKRLSSIFSVAYYLAGRKLGLDVNLYLQKAKFRGDDVEDDVQDAVVALPEGNIIIMNLSDKPGKLEKAGKSLRKYLKERNHRYVSTSSLGHLTTDKLDLVIAPFAVSDLSHKKLYLKLKEMLDKAEEVRVVSDAGTDVIFPIKGMLASMSDGDFHSSGKGGNLPVGEVYIPPSEGVSGKIVIDGSVRTRNTTLLIEEPVILTVENGSAVNIDGGQEAKALEETLAWARTISKFPENVNKIGELGIGLNPLSSIIGSSLFDEKTLGTCHFALGSNYWFGGTIYGKTHFDQTIRSPTIHVDGVMIMDKGKLLVKADA